MVSKRLHFFLLNSFCSHCYIVCSYSNTKVRAAFRATKTQQVVITTRIFPWVFLLKTESSTHTQRVFEVCVRPTFTLLPLKSHRSQCAFRSVSSDETLEGSSNQGGRPGCHLDFLPRYVSATIKRINHAQIRIAFWGFSPQNRR